MNNRKMICCTGRLDIIESYEETRVALDINMFKFLDECSLDSFILPYQQDVSRILERADAFLLSGGGDISMYSDSVEAKIRDQLEIQVIEHALKHNKKILSICRGTQLLNCYFGGTLKQVEGHVASHHDVTIENKHYKKNSYHNQAIDNIGKGLSVIAKSNEGVVEAIEGKNILGLMWHPEREEHFSKHDIQLVKDFLC